MRPTLALFFIFLPYISLPYKACAALEAQAEWIDDIESFVKKASIDPNVGSLALALPALSAGPVFYSLSKTCGLPASSSSSTRKTREIVCGSGAGMSLILVFGVLATKAPEVIGPSLPPEHFETHSKIKTARFTAYLFVGGLACVPLWFLNTKYAPPAWKKALGTAGMTAWNVVLVGEGALSYVYGLDHLTKTLISSVKQYKSCCTRPSEVLVETEAQEGDALLRTVNTHEQEISDLAWEELLQKIELYAAHLSDLDEGAFDEAYEAFGKSNLSISYFLRAIENSEFDAAEEASSKHSKTQRAVAYLSAGIAGVSAYANWPLALSMIENNLSCLSPGVRTAMGHCVGAAGFLALGSINALAGKEVGQKIASTLEQSYEEHGFNPCAWLCAGAASLCQEKSRGEKLAMGASLAATCVAGYLAFTSSLPQVAITAEAMHPGPIPIALQICSVLSGTACTFYSVHLSTQALIEKLKDPKRFTRLETLRLRCRQLKIALEALKPEDRQKFW